LIVSMAIRTLLLLIFLAALLTACGGNAPEDQLPTLASLDGGAGATAPPADPPTLEPTLNVFPEAEIDPSGVFVNDQNMLTFNDAFNRVVMVQLPDAWSVDESASEVTITQDSNTENRITITTGDPQNNTVSIESIIASLGIDPDLTEFSGAYVGEEEVGVLRVNTADGTTEQIFLLARDSDGDQILFTVPDGVPDPEGVYDSLLQLAEGVEVTESVE
jgi:ABC-type transport system substrate-binding protein